MINQDTRKGIWMELLETVEDEYIKAYFRSRLLPKIDWFHFAGMACKKKYMSWSVLSLIISSLIPVAAIFSDGSITMKALLAALGSAVSFISGYLMLHDSRNMWNWYSSAKDELTRTAFQYFTKTGEFANCSDQRSRDMLLITSSEMIIGKIHALHNKGGSEDQSDNQA